MTAHAAPPRASVVAAVDAVQAWIERRKRAVARDMHACGQSPAQLHMLGLLDELGPTTVSHIATLLGTTPPSASAMVDRMVDTGLVLRERNQDDRRVVTVSLGPAGQEALQAALGGRREMLERVLSQLDDLELKATLRVMDRLEEALSNAT
ncbi:MAG TPA: MarR family transcriptional regulator [Candidatus Dormibacteraeota bacterium]|jgi:DNA-binding MarR family transcriptional regulator